MEKISIIVPIYNCEQYLEQCLESIITQSYHNLQIILVNDGSTDHSLEICNQFKQKDKRIIIINQRNQGTSAAKNAGLSIANGQYITFVDSDDWLADSSAIQFLYNLLTDNKADVSVGNFNEFDALTNKFLIHVFDNQHPVVNYTPHDWFKNEYSDEDDISQCFSTPWGKLFKSKLFHAIRFPVNKIDEDDLTMWKIYLVSHKISYCNLPIYVYRNNRSGSITNVANSAQLFSLPAIEQRISVQKAIGYDDIINHNSNSYLWRMQKHRNEALKVAEIANFKDAQQKLNIFNKYNKTFY